MRTRMLFIAQSLMTLVAAGAFHAQIANPIQAPVEKRGLPVEIRDVVRLPDTRGLRPLDQDVSPAGWARINFVRDLPDGRRFVNDSRGLLYLIDRNNQLSVYANVGARFPLAVYNRLESGFIGFEFHPEFANNGLFYSVHGERGPGTRRRRTSFRLATRRGRDVPQRHHRVARHQSGRDHFDGTRRELLRVAHIVQNLTHPFGDVEFNPTARPGSPDYGLLYTSGSDLGFSNGGGPNANNPARRSGSIRSSAPSSASIRAAPRCRRARRGSATTRFRRPTSSRPTATRRRSARSTPTASATRTGCPGTSPTGRCSPPTSG